MKIKGKRNLDNLAIIFFPAYDWAISPSHPEREERLLYTQDQLREDGLFDMPGIGEYQPLIATEEDILRAHIKPPAIKRIAAAPHLIAAGGAIKAGLLVKEGQSKKAFALVRPPGHHARRVVHGGRGFCNINNEAIMVEYLRAHYGPMKVAIIDSDCHHGDGTEDIYWHDPDTLFISLHQDGRTLYPGSGFPHELGGPKAMGANINIPLPPETGDEGYLWAAENIVLPLLADFKPDLIINSAGQDNHFTDPLTNMRITARGYARLTEIINPDIAVLEGGYSVEGALPYLNLGICLALAGLDWQSLTEPLASPDELKTSPKNMEIIKRLADEIFTLRKKMKPENSGFRQEGHFWLRQRDIYYDTHAVEPEEGEPIVGFIKEHQQEKLYDCPHCPGLLTIKTVSNLSPLSTHKVLPQNPCPKCLELAQEC